jgi:hypothetical protein
MASAPSPAAIEVTGLRKSFGDVVGTAQPVGGTAPEKQPGRLVATAVHRLLQPVLGLVDRAELQVGQHDRPPHPGRAGPGPELLGHRQRLLQVSAGLFAPVGAQAQLAGRCRSPGAGHRPAARAGRPVGGR